MTKSINLPQTGPRTCAINGCPNPVKARGWCGMHYIRWRRHGDPTTTTTTTPPPAWIDPLTDDDYRALRASVEADAQKLLPFAAWIVVRQLKVCDR